MPARISRYHSGTVVDEIDPDRNSREQRASFNDVAALYDEWRPGYPESVYDDVIELAGLRAGAQLLEIGSGTGHATRGFARRGFAIDCVELGEQMAAIARRNLAEFPAVTITVADFEHWTTEKRYDLVFSASAYHWLSRETRVQRIAALLRPAGWIAVWRNHHVRSSEESDRFNERVQEIYRRTTPSLAGTSRGILTVDQIPRSEPKEWIASGLFSASLTRVYRWEGTYSSAEYVQMLNTHSDHLVLPDAERTALFDGISRLIDGEFNGRVTHEQATLLHMARKKP
jgi:SAM-dependent methyltransferase